MTEMKKYILKQTNTDHRQLQTVAAVVHALKHALNESLVIYLVPDHGVMNWWTDVLIMNWWKQINTAGFY